MNPTKHVLIALMLTAVLFIVAGDRWDEGIAAIKPVGIAPKAA